MKSFYFQIYSEMIPYYNKFCYTKVNPYNRKPGGDPPPQISWQGPNGALAYRGSLLQIKQVQGPWGEIADIVLLF